MVAVSVNPVGVKGTNKVVDAFIVSNTVPSPLPTTGENVVGLTENDIFAPFSILFVVGEAESKLYIANEDGEFVAQQGEING